MQAILVYCPAYLKIQKVFNQMYTYTRWKTWNSTKLRPFKFSVLKSGSKFVWIFLMHNILQMSHYNDTLKTKHILKPKNDPNNKRKKSHPINFPPRRTTLDIIFYTPGNRRLFCRQWPSISVIVFICLALGGHSNNAFLFIPAAHRKHREPAQSKGHLSISIPHIRSKCMTASKIAHYSVRTKASISHVLSPNSHPAAPASFFFLRPHTHTRRLFTIYRPVCPQFREKPSRPAYNSLQHADLSRAPRHPPLFFWPFDHMRGPRAH